MKKFLKGVENRGGENETFGRPGPENGLDFNVTQNLKGSS